MSLESVDMAGSDILVIVPIVDCEIALCCAKDKGHTHPIYGTIPSSQNRYQQNTFPYYMHINTVVE